MKIPNSVRIGGVDYEVKYTQALNNGASICYGYINYEDCTIELNPDNQKHQHLCQCLLHEILHGIREQANLEIENEETVVDTLSKGLYQVLQDNAGALFDLVEKP